MSIQEKEILLLKQKVQLCETGDSGAHAAINESPANVAPKYRSNSPTVVGPSVGVTHYGAGSNGKIKSIMQPNASGNSLLQYYSGVSVKKPVEHTTPTRTDSMANIYNQRIVPIPDENSNNYTTIAALLQSKTSRKSSVGRPPSAKHK